MQSRSALIWVAIGGFVLGIATVVLILLLRGSQASEAGQVANTVLAAPRPPVARPAAPPATIRARSAREQLVAAFAAAFGGGRATREVDRVSYTYRPGGLIWIGERAILVSPGANRDDCHACAGTLAIHYLVAAGDGFAMRGEWLTGGGFADWGRPPEWRFSSELAGRPMLRTQGGGGNQGIFCSGFAFYDFEPNGPREIARVQTAFSDNGYRVPEAGIPPTEVEGAIRNIVPDRSFEMAYTIRRAVLRGPSFAPGRAERVIERYELRRGRYVLTTGESRVPIC
jgi:hypothetical protein